MVVGQGIRFALARVVSRPKGEDKHSSKVNGSLTLTCLNSYASASNTFLETAMRVLSKRRSRLSRSSLSASQSTNEVPTSSLLRADALEELDWSMGIDADTASKSRPTVGHTAEILLELWEHLLQSCELMLEPVLEASTDFGEKIKWEKTELLIVKIMERREFNKVYEAFRAAIVDKENNPPKTPPTSTKKKRGFLRKSAKVDEDHVVLSMSSSSNDPLPMSADPVQLLAKYIALLNRTLTYASHTDIRSVMASTIYNSVFSISFCRLPRAQAVILDAFDSQGFNGSRSAARRLSMSPPAKRTFFEEDNAALFGWEVDGVEPTLLQPSLDAIYDSLQANLALLAQEQNVDMSTCRSSSEDSAIALDDYIDSGLPPPAPPVHASSSLCVSMFLALWIAMTHHILRTGRGHIPWTDIPAYRLLHSRGVMLFEKAYALQTLECDDDSNLVRYDMVLRRREKLNAAFPVDVLYPQVVFATTTKIISLTKLPHDFMAILFKHTAMPFIRAVPACVSHLEHWIGVVPSDVFADKQIRALLIKHVRKILSSDRVDRLKSMLIFLLHSTGLFDMAIQKDLLLALHDAFGHLFRHWFRDVRFCYHLTLLYLFGDRRTLGSRSDAILLGHETDVLALKRHPTWLPFDDRILEALEACRDTKQTSPYDRTSFNEYIGQLEHYYQNAEALPEGEAVPIPRIKLQTANNSRGGG
ncbi:hypothetical protein LEN26_005860 [Aphanomyces euteiches]|nr:hypothetical protein LEN26_005860 [Aphanomyces euteiches]